MPATSVLIAVSEDAQPRLERILRRYEIVRAANGEEVAGADQALQARRRDLLAVGTREDLALAAADGEHAGLVDPAVVAGVQPAFGVHGGAGGHGGAADQDLAVRGDAELQAGQGHAGGARLDGLGGVQGGEAAPDRC